MLFCRFSSRLVLSCRLSSRLVFSCRLSSRFELYCRVSRSISKTDTTFLFIISLLVVICPVDYSIYSTPHTALASNLASKPVMKESCIVASQSVVRSQGQRARLVNARERLYCAHAHMPAVYYLPRATPSRRTYPCRRKWGPCALPPPPTPRAAGHVAACDPRGGKYCHRSHRTGGSGAA